MMVVMIVVVIVGAKREIKKSTFGRARSSAKWVFPNRVTSAITLQCILSSFFPSIDKVEYAWVEVQRTKEKKGEKDTNPPSIGLGHDLSSGVGSELAQPIDAVLELPVVVTLEDGVGVDW